LSLPREIALIVALVKEKRKMNERGSPSELCACVTLQWLEVSRVQKSLRALEEDTSKMRGLVGENMYLALQSNLLAAQAGMHEMKKLSEQVADVVRRENVKHA
jgi:hypothetical protein